ncbi:hypothetical protein KL86DYS2_20095 [uncultured Dysgonomonas sp.]|uniref:Uncharacterized protein n=1 Tax=uncultured Dysgonomonas sp. TaxID=206096 RepID=A0A212KFF8_9BACT|nr:hypothetical protein KL86DYS2_20095 [uncultured Dysgonomonas sp.]
MNDLIQGYSLRAFFRIIVIQGSLIFYLGLDIIQNIGFKIECLLPDLNIGQHTQTAKALQAALA